VQLSQILDYLRSKNIDFDFQGDDKIEIVQVASLDEASSEHISFLTDKKFQAHLKTTEAAAVILQSQHDTSHLKAAITTSNPYYVYALVAQFLNPLPVGNRTIASTAAIDASTVLSSNVTIEDNVVIRANVSIGENTVIGAGTVIEENTIIGSDCRTGANVVICHDCVIGDNVLIEAGAVIGGDGFGWANNRGSWEKIPQVGRVVIGDKVSIGNNTTIDRGALNDTVIEDNCIIDNQVHIAHNVVIGSGSAVAGQTGFAGSTTLGKNCMVGGQVGFTGHIKVADNCQFWARTLVAQDIKQAGIYAGYPALEVKNWHKSSARFNQLDKMAKQLKQLEKQLAELQKDS
jgi:UDP-3-O-[3-hydroxymyristoyl] glucosamine N-acyltransferase